MQLTVISAERCAIVWRPFLEKSILLSQKCAVVGLVYLVSIALSSPPLYGWSRFSKVNEQFFCTFDYTQRDIGTRSYLFFVLVAGYLMPIAVISFSYIIIYTIVRRSDFSNLRSTNTESTTSSQLPTEGSYSIDAVLLRTRSLSTFTQKRRNEQRRQVRIAILTLVVCGTFLLCWTPFAILYVIWPLFSETLPSTTLTTIATICGKSFVIINPIIYGFNAKSWQVPAVRLSLYCGCKSNAKIRSQFCTDEGLLRKRPAGNVIQREISNE
uniref:G-protein coupled receptors family 1 profile domain-containing protein n=1 Tax=Plectus sambesii TaxID=2011161 RepID=A0A914W9L3_9BILA